MMANLWRLVLCVDRVFSSVCTRFKLYIFCMNELEARFTNKLKITYWPDVVWFCFLAEVATLPAWLPRWCRQLWLSCPSTNQGEVHSIPARDNIVFLFRWGVCRKSPYAMCCDKSLLYFQPDLVIAWFLWMSEWWNLVRFNNMQCWKPPVTLYLFFHT